MKTCINHPDKESLSICHGCGKEFCEECLSEGKEYYYCQNAECQKLFESDLPDEIFPEVVICYQCESELELNEVERKTGRVQCPDCFSIIDYNFDPPKVTSPENYCRLLSTFNQADISIIKSILDDGGIDYMVLGENFLSVRPLVEPVLFYVNVEQEEEAKALIENVDLNVWGTSMRAIEEEESDD